MKSGNSSGAGSAPRKKKVTAEAQSPVSPALASPVSLASQVSPASASESFASASASSVLPASASPVLPASALSSSSSSSFAAEEEEKEYGMKLVYLSFIIFHNPDTWIEVNPNYSGPDDENHQDCISIRGLPKMKAMGRLSEISLYGTAYMDHKVYFVGGFYTKFHYRCSNKIFIYHLISEKWEEAPFKLNVARGLPRVVIVGKLLYIFGGKSYPSEALNKDSWIECCDLDNEKPTCEFLPTTSAPPDEFFPPASAPPNEIVPILCHFVYECGSQIVFSLYEAGFYSFNYLSKTWAPLHPNIKNYASAMCFEVVAIDHVLYWHYYGVIYAYDLFNNCLLLSHPVTEQHMTFGDPVVSGPAPDYSFLVRVGNDTLLLICWDEYTKIGKDLHFYKYLIERGPLPYHLSLIGCGLFTSPGDAFGGVVLVV